MSKVSSLCRATLVHISIATTHIQSQRNHFWEALKHLVLILLRAVIQQKTLVLLRTEFHLKFRIVYEYVQNLQGATELSLTFNSKLGQSNLKSQPYTTSALNVNINIPHHLSLGVIRNYIHQPATSYTRWRTRFQCTRTLPQPC
jgi:hypothetical protein